MDFGIAKVVSDNHASVKASRAIGSPYWMAPEQTNADGSILASTDVWALGLLAFYVFTGKIYWRTAHAAAPNIQAQLKEVLFDPMPPASQRATELGTGRLPSGFDAWFERCTRRNARERFANAAEAYRAFETLDASAPVVLPPTQTHLAQTLQSQPPPHRTQVWDQTHSVSPAPPRQRPGALIAAAGGAVLFAVVAVASFNAVKNTPEGPAALPAAVSPTPPSTAHATTESTPQIARPSTTATSPTPTPARPTVQAQAPAAPMPPVVPAPAPSTVPLRQHTTRAREAGEGAATSTPGASGRAQAAQLRRTAAQLDRAGRHDLAEQHRQRADMMEVVSDEQAERQRAAARPSPAPAPAAPPPPPAEELPERLTRVHVTPVLSALNNTVRACANGQTGTAPVTITIANDGTVSAASLSGVFANTPAGQCIEAAVRRARFPRFRVATQSVSYPYVILSPREGPSPSRADGLRDPWN